MTGWIHVVASIFVCLVILSLVVAIVVAGKKESDQLYDRLNSFEDRAQHAKTSDELRQIFHELKAFSEINCWHRSHTNYAIKIAAFIRGRLYSPEKDADRRVPERQ